ncbi:hypothetical protein ABW19_dt0205856 [Dactylella cylindrospora]|nr:hypothetical protein ABW19_dt0205856 [Dactylella cylindrospora]
MNQFKPIFLGNVPPGSALGRLRRSMNSQKCIRAGGKHNDLDDVGKDSYHHTFFEMLGSWSFGDYFKKEAIEYAWELLTKVYGLEPTRLYVTYFQGHTQNGLGPDDEARELLHAMGIPDNHIVPGSMKDNFWEMGDQGPCGPCIEIHYDRIGGGRNVAHLVNQDDPDVLEIWNIVFIQYNRESDGSLRLLPSKHIDTGMGFERLVSILQNKSSNYDTDIFRPLFDRIQEVTGAAPYQGRFGSDDTRGVDTAYRVVADHVRTCTIAISDGVVPTNVGRGYVIRRILRRGARYAKRYLNAEIGTFFSKIVPTVIKQMEGTFPDVRWRERAIIEILDEEERTFALTLDRGEAMFALYAPTCEYGGSGILPGDIVWKLYDTYGFPTDLTKIMAEERGLRVIDEEVSIAQEKSREASRGENKIISGLVTLSVHDIAALQRMNDIPETDDTPKYTKDVIRATIKALYLEGSFFASTSEIPAGVQFGVILDKTNFYAESGGQVADTGRLVIEGITEACVRDVQVYGGYVLHTVYLKYGSLSIGNEVIARLDGERRRSITLNHTGTHILNFALRQALGEDLNQRGSLVAPDKLRFDFSHRTDVKPGELREIEDIVAKLIKTDLEVFTRSDVSSSTARQIEGVRAVFDETYSSSARVVSIGVPVSTLLSDVTSKKWRKYSVELCGGTHVRRTGRVKDLVILEERGIAKGVRRIVAITDQGAVEARQTAIYFERMTLIPLERMSYSLNKEILVKKAKLELAELVIPISVRMVFESRLKTVAKDTLTRQKAILKSRVDDAINFVEGYFKRNKASKSLVTILPEESSAETISDAIRHISQRNADKSVYLMGIDSATGKVAHGCYVAREHSSKGLVANNWTEQVVRVVGGKSGGNGQTSTGKGTDATKMEDGVEVAMKYLEGLNI